MSNGVLAEKSAELHSLWFDPEKRIDMSTLRRGAAIINRKRNQCYNPFVMLRILKPRLRDLDRRSPSLLKVNESAF